MDLLSLLERHYRKELPQLKKNQAEVLFNEVENLFYNKETYKWSSIKKSSLFIHRHKVEPHSFIIVLRHIFHSYYKHASSNRGKTSALNYLDTLEASKAFMKINSNDSRINIKKGTDLLELLKEFKNLSKSLVMTQDGMVQFIHQNINTGLAESTLRRYYYVELSEDEKDQ